VHPFIEAVQSYKTERADQGERSASGQKCCSENFRALAAFIPKVTSSSIAFK
jgi:hypothetical protein